MNSKRTIRNALFAATIVACAPALAEELLPQVHYAAELDRCVATIREQLAINPEARLQHRVTGVDKQNIWYEFTIETAGNEPLAVTTCRAWRFDDRTVANITPQTAGATQLAGTL